MNEQKLKTELLTCLDALLQPGNLLKGSLYKVKKRCGMRYCKVCNSGGAHEVYQFTFTDKAGIKTSTTITNENLPIVEKAWQSYKLFRKNLKRYKNLSEKINDTIRLYEKRHLIDARGMKKTKKSARN